MSFRGIVVSRAFFALVVCLFACLRFANGREVLHMIYQRAGRYAIQSGVPEKNVNDLLPEMV